MVIIPRGRPTTALCCPRGARSSISCRPGRRALCQKARPRWPASAAQGADWPRLAEAWGSLRRDLCDVSLGSAPARLLCLLRARLVALGSSALPGRGWPTNLMSSCTSHPMLTRTSRYCTTRCHTVPHHTTLATGNHRLPHHTVPHGTIPRAVLKLS